MFSDMRSAKRDHQKRTSPRKLYNPISIYKKHYRGVSRGQLQKMDEGLYRKLRRCNLLEHVPLIRPKRKRRNVDDPLAYYHRHYVGWTRSKLREHDYSLYERIRKEGLLSNLPGRTNRVIGNPLDYYQRHYPGWTRQAVRKHDISLYTLLRKSGLLKQIPSERREIDDPLAYYQKNYAGWTRGKLRKHDNKLYFQLRRAGLIKHVPRKNAEPALQAK